MEEQTIPSDAPSEYMRGYSDGVEWARQQEREECAKLCDELAGHCWVNEDDGNAESCAKAIRARTSHEIPR